MTIAPSQEEGLRLAAQKIDATVKKFEQSYSVQDKQDVLAMCALQFAAETEQTKINKKVHTVSDDENTSDKGDYKNFMSKEIFEQSSTIKKCISEYTDSLKKDINIYNFPIDPKKINKIILIGCGTAYHSCLVAKYWLEELTSIDVEIDIASEFRYRNLKFNSNNLYIFVAQSGETADTAAALDICKKNKVKTCSIVNVVESTIARNSDWVLPIHAGPEIGVASTKAFLGQLIVLYILSLKLSIARGDVDKKVMIKV